MDKLDIPNGGQCKHNNLNRSDRLIQKINTKIPLGPQGRDETDETDGVEMRRKRTHSKIPNRSESRRQRIKSGLNSFGPNATLADMTQISEKDKWFRRNRSRVYFYLVPLLGFYYFIPAIQISFISKQPQELIGSRDLCYHNFRCSRPFYVFSDFNHIISNMSFVIFGVAFMVLVWRKSRKLPKPYKGYQEQTGKCYKFTNTI